MSRRAIVAVTVWLGVCGGALAQTSRHFALEPGQVVPPSASAAGGQGAATLNAASTELSFAILHNIPAPDAEQAVATVHNADWGTNGPALFTLNWADTNSFSGIWTIDSNSVAEFHAGRLYVQIDTPAFPNGALRGQIDLNPDPQPGDVIISEIMYNPASQEGNFPNPPFAANPEWIELFNATVTDIDIGGWYLQDEDVDTNGDACTPLRGGSFPSFVLPSFRAVVIIPDGALLDGFLPTVADFKTAWFGPGGGTDVLVLQVNADGTAGGAIVGLNLSNNPVNDSVPSNDLPLSSATWQPCNPGGFPRVDNEILTLNDGTQIIDVVNYGTDFQSDWPVNTFDGSITIVPGDYLENPPPGYVPSDFSTYNATSNDQGFNWRAHTHGDPAGGARQITAAGVYGGLDVGSPGYLFGTSGANRAPTAISQQILAGPGQTLDIFLAGTDATKPFFNLLLFVIKSLPQNGQLIDVASNKVITPGMLGGSGYLMPRIPFNHVRYINNGTCGLDSFTFSTHDGLLQSAAVPIELFVQCGEVVITEIMYNPDSTEDNPPKPEWIELYNATASTIDLAGWYIADNATRSGNFPTYILGAGATVVAIPWVTDPAEFEVAWPGAPYLHVTTNGDTGTVGRGGLAGSALSNSGESLRIVKPGGATPLISDAVFYKNGFDDPAWPALSPDGPSIYILPSPIGEYTALANDDPGVWDKSALGFDGAVLNELTSIYNGDDIGSPGYLQGVTQAACLRGGPMGDGNVDGFVNLADLEQLVACLAGPGVEPPLNCGCFDADLDGDVDLHDVRGFYEVFGGAPPRGNGGLLISEVVDASLTDGLPKFVELTNCGATGVDLSGYSLGYINNGAATMGLSALALSGTLAPAASYVVSYENSDVPSSSMFYTVYGFDADNLGASATINGNDVIVLFSGAAAAGDPADGSVTPVVDVYGAVGVDGVGQVWEYTDSYAYRNLGAIAGNGGAFNPQAWDFGGPGALELGDNRIPGPEVTAILALTSPGTHTCGN